MEKKINEAVSEIQLSWKRLTGESIEKIKSTLKALARDQEVQKQLQIETRMLSKGMELYRDQSNGFLVLAYSEDQGNYRTPHDHGHAWVVYVVASGEVEMGNYFKFVRPSGQTELVLKSRERLTAGDERIYYPGEIHDTRCASENALILRLSSHDLREEEKAGRMNRYKI